LRNRYVTHIFVMMSGSGFCQWVGSEGPHRSL